MWPVFLVGEKRQILSNVVDQMQVAAQEHVVAQAREITRLKRKKRGANNPQKKKVFQGIA
jgi:hypothetical protein